MSVIRIHPWKDNWTHFLHKPNFCVAQQSCFKWIDNVNIEQPGEVCGNREHILKGEHTLHTFMTYLTQPRLQFSNIVVLAHNMKSYDGQFIPKYMTEISKWTPEVIMKDTKFQVISYGRLKTIDSLNYFN